MAQHIGMYGTTREVSQETRDYRQYVSQQIKEALKSGDYSQPPAESSGSVLAIVGGTEVDIASDAYANWYAYYYGSGS